MIAGALENGALDLWDAGKLMSGEGSVAYYLAKNAQLMAYREALVSRTSNHVGAIKALQFNPFRAELLATSGAKGEVGSHSPCSSIAAPDLALAIYVRSQ